MVIIIKLYLSIYNIYLLLFIRIYIYFYNKTFIIFIIFKDNNKIIIFFLLYNCIIENNKSLKNINNLIFIILLK